MSDQSTSLAKIFDGWEGYHSSILHAVQPLTSEQLAWRPLPKMRSVGELTSHIAFGRISWFCRMQAPGSLELVQEIMKFGSEAELAKDKEKIILWLEKSWQLVDDTLGQWTVQDLDGSFDEEYLGKHYRLSYQWTLWRVLAHDLHHGGELAVMLGMQGIEIPELGELGGHTTMPPLAE